MTGLTYNNNNKKKKLKKKTRLQTLLQFEWSQNLLWFSEFELSSIQLRELSNDVWYFPEA